MDVMTRENAYNKEIEQDKLWLREAARFSVSHHGLYENDKNRIYDVSLHEIICHPKPTDPAKIVELNPVPTDALECVFILDGEDGGDCDKSEN